MYAHFVSTWLAGLRSRSLRVVVGLAICLIAIAYLASSFSGRHPQTVALDIGISGVRIVLALLALFWVQELVARELNQRTVLFALSYPAPRYAYLLGRYAGVLALLALSTVVLAGAIYGMVMLSGDGYHQTFAVKFGVSFLGVTTAMWLDAAVIAAFALLIATLATSNLLPLVSGIGFAVVARGYGTVLALVRDPNGGYADNAQAYLPWLERLAYLIPDLGAIDFRETVLYGSPFGELALVSCVHAVVYAAILLLLAIVLFQRREFS